MRLVYVLCKCYFLERIDKALFRHAIIPCVQDSTLLLAGREYTYRSKRIDGGGIRGYSALLIIQKLMEAIGRRESIYPDGPASSDGPAKSSYHPLAPPRKTPDEATISNMDNAAEGCITDSSPWLPCHYFDYMAGTSTGGYAYVELRN